MSIEETLAFTHSIPPFHPNRTQNPFTTLPSNTTHTLEQDTAWSCWGAAHTSVYWIGAWCHSHHRTMGVVNGCGSRLPLSCLRL